QFWRRWANRCLYAANDLKQKSPSPQFIQGVFYTDTKHRNTLSATHLENIKLAYVTVYINNFITHLDAEFQCHSDLAAVMRFPG
ncbi:hypothetical protein ATANTOWER_032577, partial [Ataeniobius toweri]|nr:hypothetical protein [Ataeniobius toweri]